MSCWYRGQQVTQVGTEASGAPSTAGLPHGHPDKCQVCGQFLARSGQCVNPDCGSQSQALRSMGVQMRQTKPIQSWHHAVDNMDPLNLSPPWEAVGYKRQAYVYLTSLGIPPSTISPLLWNTKPAVWMYLPRCTCGAFLSPELGICRNPRCRNAKERVQVVPRGRWSWPPQAKSLQHVKRALGVDGEGPDAHAAWHARNDDVVEQISQRVGAGESADSLRTHLDEVNRHVHIGVQHGWLDPDSSAYDRNAHAELEEVMDDYLYRVSPKEILIGLALRGEWVETSLQLLAGDDIIDHLNPAKDPGNKPGWRLDESVKEQGDLNIARRMESALKETVESGRVPAFPPRGLGRLGYQLSELINDDFPVLKHPASWNNATSPLPPVHELYLWISKTRLANIPLGRKERRHAADLLRETGNVLGFPDSLREDEALAIVDNGLSPLEANQALQRRRRAEATIAETFGDGSPEECRKAGSQFTAQLERFSRSHGLQTKRGPAWQRDHWGSVAWPGRFELPEMTREQRRAFVAGATDKGETTQSDEMIDGWLDSAAKGVSAAQAGSTEGAR